MRRGARDERKVQEVTVTYCAATTALSASPAPRRCPTRIEAAMERARGKDM
jgi:hypothetical protein